MFDMFFATQSFFISIFLIALSVAVVLKAAAAFLSVLHHWRRFR
jgi:hypothetical protein